LLCSERFPPLFLAKPSNVVTYITARIIQTVELALEKNSGANLVGTLDSYDSMETVAEWDSLSMISVYPEINREFKVETSADDAVHYTSIQSIQSFLESRSCR